MSPPRAQLIVDCAHCGKPNVVELGAPRAPQVIRVEAPPLPAKKKGYCGVCKHDAHGREPCGYGIGIGTTVSVCKCTGKRAPRTRRGEVLGDGSDLLSTGPSRRAAAGGDANGAKGAPSAYALLLLSVLVQCRGPVSRFKLAVMSRRSPRSSSFSEALSELRRHELLIESAEGLEAAPGARELVHPEPLPTGEALLEFWTELVGEYAGTLLARIVAEHPHELTRAQLSSLTGYRATSSSFSDALTKLRKLSLVVGLRASDEFVQVVRGAP